ncbi:MAG: hypothetical protein OEM41_07650, partial [Ignavibacteria bacterium]|nr:hypothetical protein [Ignavibacteria bacterium]
PPQGAYIEKFMFSLMIFCSVEALHSWSLVNIVESEKFLDLIVIGQYVSIGVLLSIIAFLSLRLRFVTSAKGEFYEQEIEARPLGITRWRDAVDDLVIAHFVSRDLTKGQMFVDPGRK